MTACLRQMKNTIGLGFLLVALVLCTDTSANAASFSFNFNSLADQANSTSIQTYMQGVLNSALGVGKATVTVSAGALADKAYTGDGHVTGPGTGSKAVTLATSDGVSFAGGSTTPAAGTVHTSSADTFIRNVSGISSFTFTFTGLLISSASFDYEIFPDGTCTALSSTGCGGSKVGGIYPNQPDFTFKANGNTIFHQYAVGVGTATSPYTHSPNSGSTKSEKAPQFIGTWSGGLTSATALTFADWPATIGIDNLLFTATVNVPEPGSIFLFATIGLALGGCIKRRKSRC